MGVVYLAHNTLMGRDEVLKVMGRQIMERPGVLDRFLREIRAVARLRHPNIVTAYHAARLGESIVFAMEYVEGLDLSRMVKAKGPLPVGHACNFIYQAALGLQHAHEEGLIHRDIKPGNLMLSRKGDRATIKVLDFGLAKATREDKVDSALTSAGQALGTPDFIAPEQILDAMSADIRSDIYSLGGTLYYLLAGRPPFQSKSLYDVYQAHISLDADPLNLVRPEVPAELAALVAKMMAKDSARRFQTPAEVAQSLTPFFKKGNAASKSTRADLSRPGDSPAERPNPRISTASAWPAAGAAPAAPAQMSNDSPRPESMWTSLIDMTPHEAPGLEPATATSEAVEAFPPRPRWPIVATAAGLAALVLGIIIYFRSDKNGTTVAIGDPRDLNAAGITPPARIDASPAGASGDVPTGVPRSQERVVVNESSVPSADAGAPRFVSLFSGTDLTGWKTHPSQRGNWQAKAGILLGSGADVSHLYSERGDYRDFHLRLEARYNVGCNASILFCSTYGPVLPEERPTRPKGYEVPISSTHELLAGCILTAPGDVQWSSWGNPSLPLDQWFTLDLIADGDNLQVLLNGTESAYITEKQRSFSSGHLALRLSSPGSTIEFRKIEIKEFKSTDRQDPRELTRLVGHSGRVDRVCFSPDGKRILSAGSNHERGLHKGAEWYAKGADDTVRLWDPVSGQNLFTTPGQIWGIRCLAFSTDGRYAASWSGWGGGDSSARQDLSVWDLAVGRKIHTLTRSYKADKDIGVARAVAFSPDNRRVFAVFASPSIHLWDLETEEELPVIRLKAGDLVLGSATFTSDRQRLITGSSAGPVELWDVQSGNRLKALVGHTGSAGAVDRSADDRLILSGGGDETLRLWDAATGKQLQIVNWKGDGMHCMALSPDGHKALAAGNHGLIRLWDLDTGREICRLYGHTMGVNSVAFSPDGRRAVSGSDDKTVRIWKLP